MQPLPLAAGIDIGGTNVVLGLVSQKGEILWKESLPTHQYADFSQLVQQVSHRIKTRIASIKKATLLGCGIGAPNGNFYTGNIEMAPNLVWKGTVPVVSSFEKELDVSCSLTNDANAAALGEMLFGAAQGTKDFILITLGTGLGSGLVVDGKMVYGHDGFAGELGHVIVEKDGRPCGCGRRGCLETYCSATGLVKTYNELALQKIGNSASSIYQLAQRGNALALQAFAYTAEKLGLALANAVAYTSPKKIFLFGGLARAGELLLKPTRESFEKNLHNLYRGKVSIELSILNENDGAVLGAASLVWVNHTRV